MIWFLFACGPIALEFSPEGNGCENVDFDNPEESELLVKEDGDDLLVQRTMVFKSSSAEFVPTYSVDNYKIHIREYWEDDGDGEFCWTPTVRIVDHPGIDLEFWWYIGDAAISEDVLQYEAQ